MAEFRAGNITCQIAGQVVPVAEFTLAGGETIFFEQHTLLWKERTVSLTGKNLRQRGQRTTAGMPHAVIEASGPGRIAVTRDASGEVVVLPLHPGVETDVRGHAFPIDEPFTGPEREPSTTSWTGTAPRCCGSAPG